MPPVAERLERYRGARAFFARVPGNNGDKLIELGSLQALERAGLESAASPAAADLIVVNGSGGLSELYPEVVQLVHDLAGSHPRTPLIVLPSTVTLNTSDALKDVLSQRAAPTLIYAREEPTLEVLRNAGLPRSVEVELDHDMAFHLVGSPWLEQRRTHATRRCALIAERTDLERTSAAAPARPIMPLSVRSLYPAWVNRPIRRIKAFRHRLAAHHTPFAEAARETFRSAGALHARVYAGDISDPQLYSFDEFARLVVQADPVATNRLHVGILAAILGKRTFLWPNANYKVIAVFRYSLAGYRNAELMSPG